MYSKFNTALNLLPLGGNKRLLDIGCGTGAFAELLLSRYPSLEIHVMDVSEEQLAHVRKKNLPLSIKTGSITDIDYPDSSFTWVTCFGVLQNFNGSVDKAIKEMARVVERQGHLFIVTMDAEYEGFKTGERKRNPHNTYFVPEELSGLVESEGITTIKMEAISGQELEGLIVPLHRWHTFFIWGHACPK
jgi:ubiquinone/menaquinone biosynthesis C-methylase UbiE